MNTIQAKYTYDRDELLRAHRLVSYTRIRKPFRFLILFVGLGFAYLGITHISHHNIMEGVFELFLALIPIFVLWFPSFMVKKDFKESSLQNEHVVWTFSEEKIEVFTPQGESKFNWNIVIKAIQCKDGYFLFSARRIFHWLPRKAFASQTDFETFEKMVKEKVSVIKKV
jgi:hypothetical protein